MVDRTSPIAHPRRPHRGRLLVSLLALLAVLVPSGPAAAAPTAPGAGQQGWEVERSADGWTVSWHADRPVRVRDDVPVLIADGRRLGVATPAEGGRTWTTTTADPTVRQARAVTLGWSTDPVPGQAQRRAATAADGRWDAPSGPVLADDPAATGPYAVQTRDYDLGDRALTLSAIDQRVEARGRIYLPKGAPGRRPVLLFLHGMHDVCYGGDFPDFAWPCPRGQKPVPNHLGYAAMAKTLASRGYVVASVSANGVNALGNDDLDAGQRARGQLVLATLDLLDEGGRGRGGLSFLEGRVDLDQVGLMGHSRGGEGVARAALQNTQRRHPYGVRALFLIAPTDFVRLTLPGVSTAVLLPYCDGDVSDLQGQHYLDDTRLASRGDRSLRTSILMLGANHNFFNTEWSPGSVSQGTDDAQYDDPKAPCGPKNAGRLSAAEQVGAGRAYLAGFFRAVLGGEKTFLPLLDGSGARAASAGKAVVRTAHTAPAPDRTDVATLDRSVPAGAASGGARFVACAGMAVRASSPDEIADLPSTARGRPACTTRFTSGQSSHWSASPLAGGPPGTGAAHLTWSSTDGRVRLDLPRKHRDVRKAGALRLLMAPDPAVGGDQDLTVRVVDRRGRSASVAVSAVSDALRPLPGGQVGLPKSQLRTVLVPVSRLKGVDRRHLRRVELLTDRMARGAVWVSDVSFTRSRTGRSGPVRLPELRLTGSPTLAEGDAGDRTSARFTARLSKPSRSDVTFTWSAITDPFASFVLPGQSEVVARRTGQIRIRAGRTTAKVAVPVVGNDRDGDDTPVRTGVVTPAGAVLGRNTRTGLVEDDDPPPTARVAAASADEDDGVLRFPVTLTKPSDREVFVVGKVSDGTARQGRDWRVEGDEGPVVSVFVPIGSTRATLEVPLIDDRVAEPTETLTLQLQEVDGPVAEPRTVVGTIRDDD